MKQNRYFAAIFFAWLVILMFALVFLVTREPNIPVSQAQASMIELVYSDTLTQTTDYMMGNLYDRHYRYVSYRFGWNDTTTTTITFTLWLVDPVGLTICTNTVTSTINITPEIYTLGNYTISIDCPFWAVANGTIENVTGTITPTIDIYLHGQ